VHAWRDLEQISPDESAAISLLAAIGLVFATTPVVAPGI
jgi:hypothetical protein